MSCEKPKGHIKEQYILPAKKVRSIITINAVPAVEVSTMNERNEGIN
jgi:hypothetical protein